MASKKKSVGLIVLAAIVAAGVYLYWNLGGMVTRTAENIASGALGVKVNIGSIHISLTDKKVTVNTLEIGNPPGYRKAHAITAKGIDIGLNTASKQLIDFDKIEVKGSVVNLEVNDKGNMNLNDLKRLANRKEQRESAGSEQVRVIVRHMVIGASVINPSISMIERDIEPIRLPAIRFADIGKGGGINADDAIAQVVGKYLSSVEGAARSSGMLNGLPGMGEVEKTLNDAAGSLKSLFK